MKNKKGNVAVVTSVIIIATVAVGIIGWMLTKKEQKSIEQVVETKAITPTQETETLAQQIQSDTQQNQISSETENWKIFKSPTENFTLRYPNDWKLNDNREYSDNPGKKCSVPAFNCKDDFEFKSPDGMIKVRYYANMIYANGDFDKGDKTTCGGQSYCENDNVLGLEKINIQGYGEVYFLKRAGKQMELHKPVSSDTIPVIGENKKSDFNIDYSLARKDGGRYHVMLNHFANKKNGLDDISDEQFFKLDSVKKAEMIMKSLKYQ